MLTLAPALDNFPPVAQLRAAQQFRAVLGELREQPRHQYLRTVVYGFPRGAR
jgi:hypothetical protein